MANITITIPDASLTRVVTAICNKEGVAVSNANAKAAIINHVKRVVKQYEWEQAEIARNDAAKTADATLQTARTTAEADVNAIAIT